MYDLVLTGGLVIDGTGDAPRKANVCIAQGRIAAITDKSADGAQILDVSGLAVTPGFIDIHSHSDAQPLNGILPENALRQGVTTQVIGNCGCSIFPTTAEAEATHRQYCQAKRNHDGFLSFGGYAEAVDAAHPHMNYCGLSGHSNLRICVLGHADRIPTPDELDKMCHILEQDMRQGSFGMSLGLIYPPSSFAGTDELVALGKVIAKYDGILSVHMRNEGPRLFAAVEEMLDIARRSGVHLQISHLKLMGKPQWGKAPELTAMIEKAQAEGVHVTCDQYPFPASSTALAALIPRWAADGGTEALLRRVESREKTILADIAQEMNNRGGPGAVLIVSAADCPQYRGKYIRDIAQALETSPEEAVRRVLLDTKATCQCIYFSIFDEDIRHIMQKDWVCVGSDGSDRTYESSPTLHPRNFATFCQYFQTVREYQLLPIQAMVRKATGLTAQILGLKDRGILKSGNWADIVIFDPETIGTQASFLKPNVPPIGVHHVLVNGQFVVRDQQITGEKPGKGLKKDI